MMHANNDTVVTSPFSMNQFIMFVFGSWGTVANCVFFSISAYFFLYKNCIDLGKSISLFLKVSIMGTLLYIVYSTMYTHSEMSDVKGVNYCHSNEK